MSSFFDDQRPVQERFLRKRGIGGEIADLRGDLKVAFDRVEAAIPTLVPAQVQTSDDTQTVLMERVLETNSSAVIKISVSCADSGNTMRAGFVKRALFHRGSSGDVTLDIIQDDFTYRSDPALLCTFIAAGNKAQVVVTGKVGTVVNWEGTFS